MSYNESEPLISLDTGKDLSSATNPEIHYKKPDGTTGEWTATVNGQKIEYQTTDGDIDQIGKWDFQAVVDFGGSTKKGSIVTRSIYSPIKTN